MELVETLRARVRGRVTAAGDPGYDDARAVANPAVDRHPTAVVRCVDAADVVAAVRVAGASGTPVTVRGRGRHVGGWGTRDGGLVLDLGELADVRVDPVAGTVVAGPGTSWERLDAVTQRHGLAAPGGHGPEVGVVGYTLGGGIGELSRRLGLACDNAVAFDVVTAAGDELTVTATEHSDLFWALRGGGGATAVVTALTLRCHPVSEIVCGPLVVGADRAVDALRAARDWVVAAPDAASFAAVAWTAPPVAFVPEQVHLEPCLLLLPSWSGPVAQADAVLAPLRAAIPEPLLDDVGRMPYLRYAAFFRRPPALPHRAEYARGELLDELDDRCVDAVVSGWRAGGPALSLVIGPLGGAIGRVPAEATAFAHRDARWFVEVNAQWRPGTDGSGPVDAARALVRELARVSRGPYVNLLPDADDVRPAYGDDHLARLSAIRARYDPQRMFSYHGR